MILIELSLQSVSPLSLGRAIWDFAWSIFEVFMKKFNENQVAFTIISRVTRCFLIWESRQTGEARKRDNCNFNSNVILFKINQLEGWNLKCINSFDHNFARSARIEPSFCTVVKLEKLNNFYLDCFESYITKNASFESPGYLARARARARARPPAPEGWGASGPFREKRVNILPYARARPAREKKF